jgi:hypothetical protein
MNTKMNRDVRPVHRKGLILEIAIDFLSEANSHRNQVFSASFFTVATL